MIGRKIGCAIISGRSKFLLGVCSFSVTTGILVMILDIMVPFLWPTSWGKPFSFIFPLTGATSSKPMSRGPMKAFKYEHWSKQLLPRRNFMMRLAAHGVVALVIIIVSLCIGIVLYHELGHLSWIDSLLNASMILGGEGPVDRMDTWAAKIFASIYALYSGLVLLVSVGILFAPVLHRLLHKFHLEK